MIGAPAASPATERAVALVAARRESAEALGRVLAEQVHDPDEFATELRHGLATLADPACLDGQQRVAPGIGRLFGVRWPLTAAVQRSFRQATAADRPTPLLFVADRLFREPELECRWFAFGVLEQTLDSDPERTWQLLRRAAREAGDWITVDSLAHAYGKGIRGEPYRWAELELLVYSPSRWERRLVGSTIATLAHGGRRRRLDPELAGQALDLLAQLIGDAEPDVQKALSWAYRSLAEVDAAGTTAALRAQANVAVANADGHRAWVVRDSLSKLEPSVGDELREQLVGLRRRAHAPSTSRAAELSSRFGRLPDPSTQSEPPLT